MVIDRFKKSRLLWVEHHLLVTPKSLSPETQRLLSTQIFACSDPGILGTDDLITLAILHPPMVVQIDDAFWVIGNLRIAQCLRMLPQDQKVPVINLPMDVTETADTDIVRMAFLTALVFGLDAWHGKNSLLEIWSVLKKAAPNDLPHSLRTKSGFARVAKINRRIELPASQNVESNLQKLPRLGAEDD